ncbi:hypothetical protein ACJMK2_013317 [Sinanodonta woodiana]|uniref:alpha-1,6-mannosyl-glycoprotein 6-beta-N-acetylglucosaminyltransferase n=1 Tax=Sinanodonta woodiana TaxID=1069815 RepID=A0ABD3V0E8_SINWO
MMGRGQWRMLKNWTLLHRRQTIIVLTLAFFIWTVTVVNFSTSMSQYGVRESEKLRKDVINLSEKYVKALARENEGIVDGPYAGRFTAYDLKKTIAVLLESILERLNRVEDQLFNQTMMNRNITRSTEASGIQAQDLLEGKNEQCELTKKDKQLYPQCTGKIEWMKQMWKSDPCYSNYGVDGSLCSFIMYLSEVEGWCPRSAWHGTSTVPKDDPTILLMANITTNIEPLMQMLVDPNERESYAWIRMRIRRIWDRWTKAVNSLAAKQDLSGRRQKKILVHLGLLSQQSGWKFAENQFKGGPLGELVQWSDLITTLYILGHKLTITSEVDQLKNILSKLPAANSPCQSRKELPVHIIYTDIVGLRQFKKFVKEGYGKFSCLLRIVDTFGTEPAFNHQQFAKKRKKSSSWGGQNLQPQQFFNMFPHSPDNSFMGFVVEQHLNDSLVNEIPRENQALVYGKNEYMWQAKTQYLDIINKSLEVHATVYMDERSDKETNTASTIIPSYVINHGFLNGEDLHTLLRQSKVFVGLGFPYEGPAPLEAIANGAVFLNPKFNPPHNRNNNAFFKGKPTEREVTSQHPYAEQFIGEPYVYTIDIGNEEQVRSTVQKILDLDTFQAYMPYEFTEEGMIQRMNSYIEHQNFCQFQRQPSKWPPEKAITLLFGEPNKSCKDVCWEKNFICEPSHFLRTNSMEALKQHGAPCSTEKVALDIFYPALDTRTNDCILQQDELLFSCVGKQENLRRLCPCRNYIKGQIALCQGCER